ncbi:DUF2243 domain-containing protein [Arenibaculum pallidiluteum]|uniref:DUF2243 domain-containing protein n=1 Tax=Arenibaculum pallidiluteum TaxID=2812559 RepID=UPI0022A77CE1|nr:DUF2243 domain-containing protein [Arenibaculum pallidiluteum]
MAAPYHTSAYHTSPLPGFLLGFAMGGFLDGILLHQILQWHHLLSGLQGPPYDDLRVQTLADGIFHAAMYAVAAAGLWMTWRRGSSPSRARPSLGAFIAGFGVWHILDAVLAHWILGLHHIRMDGNLVLWDLVFFAIGIVALLLGLRVRRAGPGPTVATVVVVAAGLGAALPAAQGSRIAVAVPDGTSPTAILTAVAALDGRVVGNNPEGRVWILDLPRGARPGAVEAALPGARAMGAAGLSFGCLGLGLL